MKLALATRPLVTYCQGQMKLALATRHPSPVTYCQGQMKLALATRHPSNLRTGWKPMLPAPFSFPDLCTASS